MKGKIISFFIGLLLGAIISTGSIYFYTLATNSNQTTNGETQEVGGPGERNNGGTPPELPNGEAPSGAPNTQNS